MVVVLIRLSVVISDGPHVLATCKRSLLSRSFVCNIASSANMQYWNTGLIHPYNLYYITGNTRATLNVKRLNQYTAPNSTYTGGESPDIPTQPHPSPSMYVSAPRPHPTRFNEQDKFSPDLWNNWSEFPPPYGVSAPTTDPADTPKKGLLYLSNILVVRRGSCHHRPACSLRRN